MDVHRRQFQALEKHALAAETPPAVVGRAQWALDVASRRHPGVLVSAGLEQRLHQIGREMIGSAGRSRTSTRIERVLHVLTQSYEYGGHTRVVERWMLLDDTRTPTVVLTGQGTAPVPATLQRAARAAGGSVLELSTGDLMTRAWNLRVLAEEHDLVVLHVHPNDVTPVLALADPAGRPPTILFNHASDHLWIGVGVSDVIANLWDYDDRQTRERRGAPDIASTILPIPVNPRERPSRAEARAQLGIEPHARIVLAIGSEYKTAPVLEPTFTDLVHAVLAAAPEACCIAVGPEPGSGWQELHRRTDGRAMALGRRDSELVGHLLAAADVLLDTWPASGATTLLDAALAGLPVVSLSDGRADRALVRPPFGTLGGEMVHASSVAQLTQAVSELLADEPRRTAVGERAREYATANHLDGWAAHLERVVQRATERAHTAEPPQRDPAPRASEGECILHLLHEQAGEAVSLEQTLLACAEDLPPDERPRDPSDAQSRVKALLLELAEPVRRAVAAPELTPPAIEGLIREVSQLSEAGDIETCTIVVGAAQIEQAVKLLEDALRDAPGVDIQLVAADRLDQVAGPGDLVLAT